MQPIKLGNKLELNNKTATSNVQIINMPDSYKSRRNKFSRIIDTLLHENDLSKCKVVCESKSLGGYTLNDTYIHYMPLDELCELVTKRRKYTCNQYQFFSKLIKINARIR